MSDLSTILKLLDKLVELEGLIETKINQVSDVKKRKAVREAFKKRDSNALRKLLFDN